MQGIVKKIEENLFHLIPVNGNPGQFLGEVFCEEDAAGFHEVTRQLDDILQRFVQVGAGARAFGLARKIEQAAHYVAGAPRFAQHQLKVRARGGVRGKFLEGQLREARHRGQRIIQFVRHTRGHLTDRGQFGGLNEAALGGALGFDAALEFLLRGAQLADGFLQALVLVGAGDHTGEDARQRLEIEQVVLSEGVFVATLHVHHTEGLVAIAQGHAHQRTARAAGDGIIIRLRAGVVDQRAGSGAQDASGNAIQSRYCGFGKSALRVGGVPAAETADGGILFHVQQQNGSEFVGKILGQQVGGDLGDLALVGETDHFLRHLVDQAEVAGAAFGLLAQAAVFHQPGQVAGDDHQQVFIVNAKGILAGAFKRQRADGASAIS